MTHIASSAMNRRAFLRASGAALALPFRDAMRPVFGKAPEEPRRMISICTNLGVLERHFFPAEAGRNYPLPNLFVSMLQRMGIEADRFASSKGTLKGLEMAG